MRQRCLALLLPFLPSAAGAQVYHEIRYTDVSAAAGILPHAMAPGMGGGVSAADFDGDGDIDFFVPDAGPDQLYENLGNGQFQEVAGALGVASLSASCVGLWLDCDGDGDLDLVVANHDSLATRNFEFYSQTASGMQNSTAAVGLDFSHNAPHIGGMAAGDINNDGYLDLYVGIWTGQNGNNRSMLFLNNGNGSFLDISVSSGIQTVNRPAHFQPMFCDFNGDGWMDIYVAVDFRENLLFINQGNGTFLDRAVLAGADNLMNDMGLTICDFDNDGDFDIHTTNVYKYPTQQKYNLLLRNDSTPTSLAFTDVSHAMGIAYGGWGWGTTFLDANLDGWPDIAATNGWSTSNYQTDPSRLYLNLHGAAFADVATSSGFNDTLYGSGLVSLDYDRDGDLDLLQSTAAGVVRLLRNDLPPGNHLTVQPRMNGPNRFAIGTVVHATTGSLQQMRLISAGTSFMSQEPAETVFGLGQHAGVDRLRVEYPDGSVTVLDNLPSGDIVTVFPPPLNRLQIARGDTLGGDERSLLARDDEELLLRGAALLHGPGPVVHAELEVDWTTLVAGPTTLDVELFVRADQFPVFAAVKLWNWSASRFDLVRFGTLSAGTPSPFAALGVPASAHVDAFGRIRMDAQFFRLSPGGSPFEVGIDQVQVTAH